MSVRMILKNVSCTNGCVGIFLDEITPLAEEALAAYHSCGGRLTYHMEVDDGLDT